MPKRKKKSRKHLGRQERMNGARRWLESRRLPNDLAKAYAKRYGVSSSVAREELMAIGYYNQLCIQDYEERGIEWEYRVEPLSGDMFVVPVDTEYHELYLIHPII